MSEILALLFSVVIALSQAPKLMVWVQTANDNTRAAATAEQQKKLIDASTRYIQQYNTNLQAVATPTTSAIVTVPMLQAVQLLDVSFSATNPFGQTWQTEVLQPTPGKLSALVLSSGGQAMDDKAASKIATLVGQAGGFIPKNNSGIYAPSVAYGSYGGWTLPTAGYTLAAGGHLAAMLSFTSGQLASNYLYRNAVPGQPQLNRMGTDLDLGTNNLSNAGSITSNGRVTAGEYVQIKGVVVENTACSSNDLFARDATNLLLSCQSGSWKKAQGSVGTGIQGAMAPFRGMTASCSGVSASVDLNGNYSIYTYGRLQCTNKTPCLAEMGETITFNGIGISVSIPNNGGGGDGTSGITTCNAYFPAS